MHRGHPGGRRRTVARLLKDQFHDIDDVFFFIWLLIMTRGIALIIVTVLLTRK